MKNKLTTKGGIPIIIMPNLDHLIIRKDKMEDWIEIDTPEDVDCDTEVLLFDGCDFSIDYVDTDFETGVAYFANGATGTTHYKLLVKPK